MPEVFIGLGSNARPVHHLRPACEALADLLQGARYSGVYRSAAVGGGADYLNMVVGGHCELSPEALQAALKRIEAAAGRVRGSGVVSLDLDLLLHGDRVDAALRLPRGDVLEHDFVLGPLVEIAPAHRHPLTGRSLAEHWRERRGADGASDLTLLGALERLEDTSPAG